MNTNRRLLEWIIRVESGEVMPTAEQHVLLTEMRYWEEIESMLPTEQGWHNTLDARKRLAHAVLQNKQ